MRKLLLGLLALIAMSLSGPAMAEKAPQPGLFVKPGESWAFKVVDGQPSEPRLLTNGEQSNQGEIMVRFSADGSMLQVRSRAEGSYNYQAFIARKPDEKGKRTSVCTLIPGVMAMESWPGGLPGIRLTNFTEAGEGMICA
jgi:hypothetical protein